MGLGRTNLRIQENDFQLPRGIRVLNISPSFLSIDIAQKFVAPNVTDEEK